MSETESCEQRKSSEYHVASYLAQVIPGSLIKAKETLESLEGVEVHGESAQQKIVVTIEGDSHSAIAKIVDDIHDLTYINSLAQIYHQYMDEEQLKDESP